jgi:hypothetical protein
MRPRQGASWAVKQKFGAELVAIYRPKRCGPKSALEPRRDHAVRDIARFPRIPKNVCAGLAAPELA